MSDNRFNSLSMFGGNVGEMKGGSSNVEVFFISRLCNGEVDGGGVIRILFDDCELSPSRESRFKGSGLKAVSLDLDVNVSRRSEVNMKLKIWQRATFCGLGNPQWKSAASQVVGLNHLFACALLRS